MKIKFIAAAAILAAAGASAAPRVATDIAPVHSLAAMVMRGVGEPALLSPASASPHHHAMRPSEARALAGADAVFWVGPMLTPWLDGPIDQTAGDARSTPLIEAPNLTFRAAAVGHDHNDDHGHDEHGHDGAKHDDHGHGEAKHDDHGHEETHDDHGHDDHAAEAKHDDHDERHGDHAHGDDDHHDDEHHDDHADKQGRDPHIWLSPENAIALTAAMAQVLAEVDPENAATYRANAAAAKTELEALATDLEARLAPLRGRELVMSHDAFGYYADRFGLVITGALTSTGAEQAQAANAARLRDMMIAGEAVCILSDGRHGVRIAERLAEDSGARLVEIDQLGAAQEPGAKLYPEMMRRLASSIETCFSG